MNSTESSTHRARRYWEPIANPSLTGLTQDVEGRAGRPNLWWDAAVECWYLDGAVAFAPGRGSGS